MAAFLYARQSVLSVQEAVVNAINYAYPEGKEGVPFDSTAAVPPDTRLAVQDRPIGGLGILFTRKFMDSVSYSRKEGKNVLTLTKIIV